jgi:hypothetical protein
MVVHITGKIKGNGESQVDVNASLNLATYTIRTIIQNSER